MGNSSSSASDKEIYRNLRSLIEEEEEIEDENEEPTTGGGATTPHDASTTTPSAKSTRGKRRMTGSVRFRSVKMAKVESPDSDDPYLTTRYKLSENVTMSSPTMTRDVTPSGFISRIMSRMSNLVPTRLSAAAVATESMRMSDTGQLQSPQKDCSGDIHFKPRDKSPVPEMLHTKIRQTRISQKTRRDIKNINPTEWKFPFKNLVFEGGGNKGIAHCGALQYLEEVGVMDQIKRVAGASAGSIMAALVAVGHTAEHIREEMIHRDMKNMFKDAWWFQIPWNVIFSFGMHKSDGIYDWLGKELAAKVREKLADLGSEFSDEKKKKFKIDELNKNPEDINFQQVHLLFDKELCVVVTNLSRMSTEFCHPKTTPTLSVREAVRMSASLPVLFTAKRFQLYEETDTFVDGGLLCNFPIHCFDGWYLSMETKDSNAEKMKACEDFSKMFKERFKETDKRKRLETLGISLYAENEEDFLKNDLERIQDRQNQTVTELTTELYTEWKKKLKKTIRTKTESQRREEDTISFLEELPKAKQELQEIDLLEVEKALGKVIQKPCGTKQELAIKEAMKMAGSGGQVNKKNRHKVTKALKTCLQKQGDTVDGREEDPTKLLREYELYQKRRNYVWSEDPEKVFKDLEKQSGKPGKILYDALIERMENVTKILENITHGWRRVAISKTSDYASSLLSTIMANMKISYIKSQDKERTVGVNTLHVETDSFDLQIEDKEFLLERGKSSCKKFLQYFVVKNPGLVN